MSEVTHHSHQDIRDNILKRVSKRKTDDRSPKKPPFSLWFCAKKTHYDIHVIFPHTLSEDDKKKIKHALHLKLEQTDTQWIGNIFRSVIIRYNSRWKQNQVLNASCSLRRIRRTTGSEKSPIAVIGKNSKDKLEISRPWLNGTFGEAISKQSLPITPLGDEKYEVEPESLFSAYRDIVKAYADTPLELVNTRIKSDNIMIQLLSPKPGTFTLTGHPADPSCNSFAMTKVKKSLHHLSDSMAMMGYILPSQDSFSLALVLAEYLYDFYYYANIQDFNKHRSEPCNFTKIQETIKEKITTFSQSQSQKEKKKLREILKENPLNNHALSRHNLLHKLEKRTKSFSRSEAENLTDVFVHRFLHMIVIKVLANNLALAELIEKDKALQNLFYDPKDLSTKRCWKASLEGLNVVSAHPIFHTQLPSYILNELDLLLDATSSYHDRLSDNQVNYPDYCKDVLSAIEKGFYEEGTLMESLFS